MPSETGDKICDDGEVEVGEVTCGIRDLGNGVGGIVGKLAVNVAECAIWAFVVMCLSNLSEAEEI